jgi:hypothetical protein
VWPLHVGFMDAGLTAGIDQPKSDPADIARIAVDGIAAGDVEILSDEVSNNVRARLAGGVAALYPGTRRSQLLSVTRWIEASVQGPAAVDVRDFAGDLGLYSDFSAVVLDGH